MAELIRACLLSQHRAEGDLWIVIDSYVWVSENTFRSSLPVLTVPYYCDDRMYVARIVTVGSATPC